MREGVWVVGGGKYEKGRERRGGGGSTWLVQTLLKDTNANVCASIVEGRSFFARSKGRAMAERKSCGMKARDSRCKDEEGKDGDEDAEDMEEER